MLQLKIIVAGSVLPFVFLNNFKYKKDRAGPYKTKNIVNKNLERKIIYGENK